MLNTFSTQIQNTSLIKMMFLIFIFLCGCVSAFFWTYCLTIQATTVKAHSGSVNEDCLSPAEMYSSQRISRL